MGIKIHRATGYGMPWLTFRTLSESMGELAPHPENDDDFYERFRKRFDALTAEQLTISKEERRLRTEHAPYTLEPHLLAKSVTMGGRVNPEFGRARNLYQLVMNPDKITDIIFFPNMIYANAWFRSDSTVDYMFERFGQGVDVQECVDFTRYVRHGVHPYDKFLVDKNNQPLSYSDHCIEYEDGDSGIRGAVPQEIRWYLTKFGFLDDAGVNELRPVVAQWWC